MGSSHKEWITKQLGIKALYTSLIGERGKESFFGKHIGFQEEKLEDMKVSDKVYLEISHPSANGQSPFSVEAPAGRGCIANSFSESSGFNQIRETQQRCLPLSPTSSF